MSLTFVLPADLRVQSLSAGPVWLGSQPAVGCPPRPAAERAGETTRLNQVEAGRDRLEWRQTAKQSVSLAWLPLSQARQPTFHLYQPGRFQRSTAVGDQMLLTLGLD